MPPICTNSKFTLRGPGGRPVAAVPCEMCGHTSLLHPGEDNPALERCVACEQVALLPPVQGPARPLSPADLPPTTVHFVLNTNGDLVGTTLDDGKAYTWSRDNNGLVVSWVASADNRPQPQPGWAGTARAAGRHTDHDGDEVSGP